MKQFVMILAALTLMVAPAYADKIVDLNSSQLNIDNQLGEKIVLRRTKSSPQKVTINMNPEARHSSSCDHWSSSEQCSSAYCSDDGDGDGNHHGGGGGWSGGGGWGDSGGSGGGGSHGGGGCHRVQGSDGIWRDECSMILVPASMMSLRECCTTSSTCDSYSDHTYNDYVDFTLEFKDNLLEEGETDELQLISLDRKKAELTVLTSKRPYQVKTGGFFSKRKFTLKQK